MGVGKRGKVKEKNFDFDEKKKDFTTSKSKAPSGKKKVFDDNEGEYIEFEEIKD